MTSLQLFINAIDCIVMKQTDNSRRVTVGNLVKTNLQDSEDYVNVFSQFKNVGNI